MVELNIKNDNGVYDLHFRSDEKETVMKVYSSLAKHFNKITEGAQVVSQIQEPTQVYEQPVEVDIDKMRKMGEEPKKELFEENDFKEDYSKYTNDTEFSEGAKLDANKALQSTEEMAKQITAEEKEKAEKRKSFYAKVLYEVSKESAAFYSLLSLGYPIGSDGGTLIVNLPNDTYNTIAEDKRIGDVISNAIKKVSNNSSISIKFQPEGDINVIDKLKNRLGAEEVEILY